MATLNPYLAFDGNARDAMEFYRDVFGGELNIMTFGDMGTEGDQAAKVMHAQLDGGPHGFTLMGSDMPPGQDLRPGNQVSVSLSGDQSDGLRGYWDRLSDGGTVMTSLEKQMWGDEFGMCADRFGIAWLVNIAAPQA
ncbi:MAG: VOC family protein [Nocardioides sp.]